MLHRKVSRFQHTVDARPSSNDAVGCSKDGIEEADAGDEKDGEPISEVVNHCSLLWHGDPIFQG